MVAIAARFEVHCATYPLPGVRDVTDVAMTIPVDGGLVAAIIDPIGQGLAAAALGREAAAAIRRSARLSIAEILTRVHQGAGETVGVSVAIARLGHETAEFGGIGRGYGAVIGAERMAVFESSPGRLGVGLPKPPLVHRLDWHPGEVFVLAADGLVDAWDLAAARGRTELPMPALVQRLAGYAARLPEDASIVVVRQGR